MVNDFLEDFYSFWTSAILGIYYWTMIVAALAFNRAIDHHYSKYCFFAFDFAFLWDFLLNNTLSIQKGLDTYNKSFIG